MHTWMQQRSSAATTPHAIRSYYNIFYTYVKSELNRSTRYIILEYKYSLMYFNVRLHVPACARSTCTNNVSLNKYTLLINVYLYTYK